MTILFIDQFGEIGGAQRALLDLVPAVMAHGWTAAAAVPDGPLADALRVRGVAVEPIRCGPYHQGHKSAADAVRFARDLAPLARHVAASPADLLYVNGPRVLPAAAWARRGRPLVFHCHNSVSQRYAAALVRASLRLAAAGVLASSRFAAAALGCEARLIYNGVAPRRERPSGFPPHGPWRIGVVGRIGKEKGQAEFLAAARLLVREAHNCRFILCGKTLCTPASLLRLHTLAEGLPVEFAGWCDDPFPSLDLLVVPSVVPESCPLVILEAYAAGVPVVAFPCGGIPEILEHGRTGFLVEPATPEALAQTLHGLICGPPQRLASVAGAARVRWRERFTLARFQNEVLDAVGQAAARGRAVAA